MGRRAKEAAGQRDPLSSGVTVRCLSPARSHADSLLAPAAQPQARICSGASLVK